MADASLDRWWKPKATNLLAVLYVVTVVTALPVGPVLLHILPAVVTIVGIGTFGHLVNDWFDRGADQAVGKPNRLAGLRNRAVLRMFGASLMLAAIPWAVLPWDRVSIVLLTLEFALLVVYAAPPLRLKLRPGWAVVADGAYAYAIPASLAAHTFFLVSGEPPDRLLPGALFVWQQALGMRHFLNHVALDRHNDLATGTRTLATERGNAFVHRLIRRWVLPVECAGFAATFVVAGRYAWPLPAVLAGLFLVSLAIRQVTTGRRFFFGPYRFSETSIDRTYQQVLPIVLLAVLSAADWRFVTLAGLHAILFIGGAGAVPAKLVPALAAILGFRRRSGHAAVPARVRPQEHRADVEPVAITGLPIAIVNINKAKYTETFVHGPISKLRVRVEYLYGGELPEFDRTGRGFLPWRPSLQLIARLLERLLRLGKDFFLSDSIGRYLQTQQVRLVLAHFGPTGARLAPLTRDLGIPLVVWFHGYDAFNRQLLREQAEGYRQLFQEADRILAVSLRMLDALRALGAPAEKLVHLPAYVDLASFPYTDHSRIGPRYLAVGRFAETKSPHLTILAFERVVQRVPAARLTLVGKGGGGELFEACLILVRALGLSTHVDFKGVLSHADVAAEMQRARVFVQHSVTTPEEGEMEGKPVAIMEAMACGLPVVATRHSGIVELIDDQVSGFLVDEFDVAAMAETMLRLVDDDESVRRVGENASRRVHGDPLLRDHVEILERIIGESVARNSSVASRQAIETRSGRANAADAATRDPAALRPPGGVL